MMLFLGINAYSKMSSICETVMFETEQEAYDYFCRVQNYSGPMKITQPIKDSDGKDITDWRQIALECVYAPTSNVYAFKTMERYKNTIRGAMRTMKKGDIIVIDEESGYRNNGTYLHDGNDMCKLSSYPDDYGSIPAWGCNLPITYFSVPSVNIQRDYGVIDHNAYAPVANTEEDCLEWCEAINKMVENNREYAIVKGRYLVFNNGVQGKIDFIPDEMYLTQNPALFQNFHREHMPEHGIVHESLLMARPNERDMRKKTGIPVHQMYYISAD